MLAAFLQRWGRSSQFPWHPRIYLDMFQPQGEVAALPSPPRRVIVVGAIYEGHPLTDWSIFTMRQMAGIHPYEEFSMEVAITDAEWNNEFEDFKKNSRRWLDNNVMAFGGSVTRETNSDNSSTYTSTSTLVDDHKDDVKATASVMPNETLSFSMSSESESCLEGRVQWHSPSEVLQGSSREDMEGDHNTFALREMITTLNEHHSHVTYIAPTHPGPDEHAELERLLDADYGGRTLQVFPENL